MRVEIDTGTGEWREERDEDACARLARRHVLLSRQGEFERQREPSTNHFDLSLIL